MNRRVNRRDLLKALVGITAGGAVAVGSRRTSGKGPLRAVHPYCPECGMAVIYEQPVDYADLTGEAPVRCGCGWSGRAPRFMRTDWEDLA